MTVFLWKTQLFNYVLAVLFFRLMMCVLICISMHVLPGCGELGPC